MAVTVLRAVARGNGGDPAPGAGRPPRTWARWLAGRARAPGLLRLPRQAAQLGRSVRQVGQDQLQLVHREVRHPGVVADGAVELARARQGGAGPLRLPQPRVGDPQAVVGVGVGVAAQPVGRRDGRRRRPGSARPPPAPRRSARRSPARPPGCRGAAPGRTARWPPAARARPGGARRARPAPPPSAARPRSGSPRLQRSQPRQVGGQPRQEAVARLPGQARRLLGVGQRPPIVVGAARQRQVEGQPAALARRRAARRSSSASAAS